VNNKFDNNIKNKIHGAEMPVSDGLWASIESQIPIKKERPKYWMFLLLTAFATPFLLYTLKSNSETTAESTSQYSNVIDLETVAKATTTASIARNSDYTKNSIPSEFLTNNQISKTASTNISVGRQERIEKEATATRLTKKRLQREGMQKEIQRNGDNANTKRSTNSNNTFNSNNKETLSESGKPLSNLNFRSNPSETNLSNWITELTELPFKSKKKLKFISNPFNKESTARNKNNLKLIEKSRIYQKVSAIKAIPQLSKNEGFSSIIVQSDNRINAAEKKMVRATKVAAGCPSFLRFRSGVYVFSDIKISLLQQKLEAKTSEQVAIIASRNKTEEELMSTSYTFGIGKVWNSGFIFESGINFDNILTKFLVSEGGTTVIEIDTFLLPGGGMQIVQDTFNIVGEGIKNKFNQINIPVRIGYDLPITEKISLAAKAGVLINLASSNNGKIMTEEGTYRYSSAERSLSLFKTNLGLSYTGGMDINMQVSSKIAGYAGIHCNYYPSNFGLSTYGIKQTYLKYGLTAGLRYSI